MPWCPNCKSEYRDGFTVCAECGTPLVAKLPQQAPRRSAVEDTWTPTQLDGEKKSGNAVWFLFVLFGVCLLGALALAIFK